ncbi:MAG: protein kinase [Deltaproteobacteria bacterium]|jgi:serine/threonine protein kinase|nr:protein kinase [Deltaproteobacteria bacterium]
MTRVAFGAESAGTARCPKCRTGYRLNPDNLGHRSICVKCGQYFHLLPESDAADTLWEDTTAALNELAARVWEKGLDLRVGQVVLGVYVVQEILGRGGLGQVFKVRHRDWQRELALKLPHRNVMEPRYFQTLKNEAETWVAMGLHPNVVTCYYARPLMGVPAIFMEFVPGGSLRKHMEPGPGGEMPVLFRGDETERTLRFLDIAVQASRGLEYAHGRGVLHLDIKPQNLLVEEDTGRLLVTDFGLARAAMETESPGDSASLWPGDLRSPDSIVAAGGRGGPRERPALGQGAFGTPQYMSPEAVERRLPTAGFDLWSLALTLLEMFLGERPWEFGGSVGAALESYVAPGKPLTPLPGRVLDYLRKSLAPDPRERHQRASEVTAELIAIHEEVAGREYPRPKPLVLPDSADNLNNRAVSMLDLGRPEEAEKLWNKALKDEPDHLTSFFNLALHRFRRKTLSPEEFQGKLDDLVRMSGERSVPELPLIMCGGYLELGMVAEANHALNSYDGPALNHEAKRLSDILERGRKNPEHAERMRPAIYRISKIRDRAPDAREARKILEPLLSAGARLLEEKNVPKALEVLSEARRHPEAAREEGFFDLWKTLYESCPRTGLADVVDAKSPSRGLKAQAAQRAGDLLVLSQGQKLSFIKHFDSAVSNFSETKLANPPVALAISNDARMTATITGDGHLWLFNPATGGGLGQTLAHRGPARALAFSADDARLFTGGDDGTLKMWDTGHGYLDKGTPLLVRKISERPILALFVSPNGRLLSVIDDESEHRVSADRISGPVRTHAMTFPGRSPYHLKSLAADPFNRYFVSSWEEGIHFHKLFDTDFRPDLANIRGAAAAVAVSPDSGLWAYATSEGRVVVGYAPQESSLAFLPIKSLESAGPAHFLDFTDDNAHLMAIGQNGLTLFRLDWNLALPRPQGWDRRCEIILSNFAARRREIRYSENLLKALGKELARGGMPSLDPNLVANKLKEAVSRTF